jgi:hypothetical protein
MPALAVPEVTAVSAVLLHTCLQAHSSERAPRNGGKPAAQYYRAYAATPDGCPQLKETMIMNMKLSDETNGIRELSATEVDAVSGATYTVAFNFTVAGMSIKGGYDAEDGNYDVTVKSGDKWIVQGGTV